MVLDALSNLEFYNSMINTGLLHKLRMGKAWARIQCSQLLLPMPKAMQSFLGNSLLFSLKIRQYKPKVWKCKMLGGLNIFWVRRSLEFGFLITTLKVMTNDPNGKYVSKLPNSGNNTDLFNFKASTFEMMTWAEPIYFQLTWLMPESLGPQSREREQDLALKFHYSNRKVCKSHEQLWWTFHKQHKYIFNLSVTVPSLSPTLASYSNNT